MRKFWIAFVAAALVVGCGGSGGDGGGGAAGGGGGGGAAFGVNLGTVTDVQILFPTGSNRRAPGSQYITLGPVLVENGAGGSIPATQTGSPIRMQLDAYAINSFTFAVPLGTAATSIYTSFPLRIDRIEEENGAGVLGNVFNGPPFTVAPSIPVDMTLYAGRQVSIAAKLNETILNFSGGTVNFNMTQFNLENNDPITDTVNSFLSDFVSFDVSGLAAAARPDMDSGAKATRVLFSGDAIAMANGENAEGTFNILRPTLVEDGVIKPPVNLGTGIAPGTWTAIEPDPSDPFGASNITALQGIWKNYTEVLTNIPNDALIIFPNSRRSTSMQAVLIRRVGGAITALWQGNVEWTGNNGTIELWSLDQLNPATANNTASGTISGTASADGFVRSGTFNLGVTPAGFPLANSGQFIVFMK